MYKHNFLFIRRFVHYSWYCGFHFSNCNSFIIWCFKNHLFYKQNIFIYKYFLVVILYTYYFVTGLLCIILGVVIWVLDLRFPELVTNFFGVDPLQDDSFVQGKSVLCHTSIKLWCVQFLYRQWCQIWVGPQTVFAILTVFFKTQIWKFSSNIILSPMFKDP